MKKRNLIIIPLIIFLALGTFVVNIQAQSDDQPLDDEFVEALVMMSINHNMMEGKDEIRDLTSLRDFVSDYYDDRYESEDGDMTLMYLNDRKIKLVSKLDAEIQKRSGMKLIDTMLKIFTSEEGLNIARDAFGIKRFVSGSDDPPDGYFETMNSLIMTDFEAQVNLLLDIDTIAVQPSLTTVVNDHSMWSLNLPAISNLAIAQTNYTKPNTGIGDSAPPAAAKDDENIKKPVRFTNNGYESVTVVVESYQPATGYDQVTPVASTVVFPDSNTTAYMELPLGSYTFCYEWQLDQDANNDDHFDYHHRITSAISLSQNASSNPGSAISVALSPDSTVSNPNGKCGQDLPASNGNLTNEEAANAGSHTYLMSCIGHEWCEAESELVSLDIAFSSGSMTVVDKDISDEVTIFSREDQNQYIVRNDDGASTLLLTMQGFTLQISDTEVIFIYELQENASTNNSSVPASSEKDNTASAGLTQEEAANSGIHTYLATNPDGNTYIQTSTFTFSNGSQTLMFDQWGDDPEIYTRRGPNQFAWIGPDGADLGIITFVSDGYILDYIIYGPISHKLQD